jgi:hypothetical protein
MIKLFDDNRHKDTIYRNNFRYRRRKYFRLTDDRYARTFAARFG